VALAVEQAAGTIGGILDTHAALDEATTTQVAAVTSELIGVLSSSQAAVNAEVLSDGGSADGSAGASSSQAAAVVSGEAAANELGRTVTTLALKAMEGASNRSVSLLAPNLNLTAQERSSNQLDEPIVVPTADEQPIRVSMPTTILSAAAGVNTSKPLNVVLFTTTNLRSLRVLNRPNATSTSTFAVQTSATVSFSLVQVRSPKPSSAPTHRNSTLFVRPPLHPHLARAGRRRAARRRRSDAHQRERAVPAKDGR
jgi:hypothetical protein